MLVNTPPKTEKEPKFSRYQLATGEAPEGIYRDSTQYSRIIAIGAEIGTRVCLFLYDGHTLSKMSDPQYTDQTWYRIPNAELVLEIREADKEGK